MHSTAQGETGLLPNIRRKNVCVPCTKRKPLLVGNSSALRRHPFFIELLAYVNGGGIGRRVGWMNVAEALIPSADSLVTHQ